MLNKIKKVIKRNEKFIRRLLISIIIVIIIAVTYVLFETSKTQTINNRINNTTEEIKIQIEEKQKIIDELNIEIEELKQKQKELEETIEQVKIAKAEAKKKTVTSRGGSSSATAVQVSAAPISKEKWVWANVSAYCACVKCCGKTNGITASGAKATANHTIAAPSTYKFGTKIEIAGMGIYTVEDRGGAITGNKLDIYFNSHSEALKFGRRNLQIRVVE